MLATVSGESCFIWNIYFQFYHWKNKVVFYSFFGAIALLYPPRVRVRATFKLSAAFFHDESSITMGGGGVQKCNSTFSLYDKNRFIFTVCLHIICLVLYSCLAHVFYNSWKKIHSWSIHAAFWGRFLRCGQVTLNK